MAIVHDLHSHGSKAIYYRSMKYSRVTYFILIASFIALRLILIHRFPLFADEVTYIDWAQQLAQGKTHPFVSLELGIEPFFIWVAAFFYQFSHTPLLAGRLTSLLFDTLTLITGFQLTKRLISKNACFIFGILYTLFPLTLLHSSLALLDITTASLMGMAVLGSVVLTISQPKPTSLFLLPLALTLALLTKPLALVSVPALFLAPLLLSAPGYGLRNVLRVFSLSILGIIVVGIINFPFRESVGVLYKTYKKDPFVPLAVQIAVTKLNLWRLKLWLTAYCGIATLITLVSGGLLVFIKKNRRGIFLLSWFSTVLLLEIIIGGKIFYPRHTTLAALPIILFITLLLTRIKPRFFMLLLFMVISVYFVRLDSLLLTQPTHAHIALEDRFQFFEDWVSGIGLPQVQQELIQLSLTQPIVVFVERDNFVRYALTEVYPVPNATFILEPLLTQQSEALPPAISQQQKISPTYILLNRKQSLPPNWSLIPVYEFAKTPTQKLLLYEVR